MDNNIENSISTKDLLSEYSWYKDTFSGVIQDACDDFFEKNFSVNFIALSKNINCLLDKESCFVTKIQIDKEYDMFFRLTEKVIEIILDKVLGKNKGKFNINKISDLETKVITSFNRELFTNIKEQLKTPSVKEIRRENFDMINLTFILKNIEQGSKDAGKIIITIPEVLLEPQKVTSQGEKFSEINFPNTVTTAKVMVGKTKFSLYDLKNLEPGDMVVFEDSNIHNFEISVFGQAMSVNVNPNMNILVSEEVNNGGNNMADGHNIWDSIEVEMNAEFDAVKITLGELKDIEKGLVVDLASLYDNKVTLKVEGNPIASGDLVIVNDRYGVKIDEIIAPKEEQMTDDSERDLSPEEGNDDYEEESYDEDSGSEEEYESEEGEEVEGEDEEFDYSDFELEDEII